MSGLKQGFHGTPEYRAYHDAKNRCTNPNNKRWPHYGGRGIEFRFTSFAEFFAEVGPKPEGKLLDRRNNDGHYEPGNVRWVTHSESLRNRGPMRRLPPKRPPQNVPSPTLALKQEQMRLRQTKRRTA